MHIPQVSRDELVSLYCKEKLPMRVLAERFSCSISSVSKRLKEEQIAANIPLRDYAPTEKQREFWAGDKSFTKKPRRRGRKPKEKTAEREFGYHERMDKAGYILVYCPDHPHANYDGYVFKHRLVIEKKTGEYLSPDLVVHHINFKRDDNRIENLRVMTKSEHRKLHSEERKKKKERSK